VAVNSAESGPWPAPAKLNLMLRIVGRRADGYHELQTVFQFLELADRLFFRITSDPTVARASGASQIPPEQDLVVRAARLLQAYTGCRLGVRIRLDKRLPLGGGLGGGSSDAATTLAVLNDLWGLQLPAAELAQLGLRLGADVPVFLFGRAAWGEGVGERLAVLDLPEPWYLVLRPDCEVSTAAVFQDPELTRNSPRIKISDFVAGQHGNDCLAVVRRRYPAVAEALDWLSGHAEARLTGTGSCVFAAFANPGEAETVRRALPAGVVGYVARGCNESPLRSLMERRRGRDEGRETAHHD
jgi:4-diphosphocytidyl-2-C-methyl-D-erythritol kinase